MGNNLKLPIVLKKDNNDTFLAYCPILKGCHTFGESDDEIGKNLEEVVGMYFDMYKHGEKDIFDGDSILYLNFDKDGKITSDFSKELVKEALKNSLLTKKIIFC